MMTMRRILDSLANMKDLCESKPGYDVKHDIATLMDEIHTSLQGKITDQSKGKKIILVDFDGVINSYKSGFDLYNIPDAPLLGAFDFLEWAVQHYDVRIFSARCNDEFAVNIMINWFIRHGAKKEWLHQITFEPGKPSCHAIIDDRAMRFMGSFKSMSDLLKIGSDPWYYRLPEWGRKSK